MQKPVHAVMLTVTADDPAAHRREMLEELKTRRSPNLNVGVTRFAGKHQAKLDKYLGGAPRSRNQMPNVRRAHPRISRRVARAMGGHPW
jgi:hypothetical protein